MRKKTSGASWARRAEYVLKYILLFGFLLAAKLVSLAHHDDAFIRVSSPLGQDRTGREFWEFSRQMPNKRSR